MKRIILVALLFGFIITSCKSVHTNGNGDIPPGQMKKLTGSQSAKEYAPGQQKKKAKDY